MKIQYILFLAVIVFTACQSKPFLLKDESITSETACLESNDQYWHNNICWNGAAQIHELTELNLEEELETYQKELEQAYVRIDQDKYSVDTALLVPQDGALIAIFIFSVDAQQRSIAIITTQEEMENSDEKPAQVNAQYSHNNVVTATEEEVAAGINHEGKLTLRVTQVGDEYSTDYVGLITGGFQSEDEVEIKFSSSILAGGTSQITVEGDRAILSGIHGTNTYLQLQELSDNPDINTLVLYNIPGTVDFTILSDTGRLIRDSGWNTYVPKDSTIESGGIDLLMAGVERSVEKGAQVGIHSWCCFESVDISGADLPPEHPTHEPFRSYAVTMLGEEWGPQFYVRTLEAAPTEGMHYMTVEEMKKYNLATEIIE